MPELKIPVDKKYLSQLLESWFDETKKDVNRWNRDPVGMVIKNRLKAIGHWKLRSRGIHKA